MVLRKHAITSLEVLHSRYPGLVTSIVQFALMEAIGSEKTDTEFHRRVNYAPVLMACASFGETSLEEKQKLLCDLLLAAHDPKICMSSVFRPLQL